jgi:hypothetical protein
VTDPTAVPATADPLVADPASSHPQPQALGHGGHPVVEPMHHRRERDREAITMALYVGISLLAVMLALPSDFGADAAGDAAVSLFLTSVGLIVAHLYAFRLSTRLLHEGQLPPGSRDLMVAQAIGGAAVTVVAIVPVLLFQGPTGLFLSKLALTALIAGAGYNAARAGSMGRLRSLAYVGLAVFSVLIILGIKGLVHH